MEKYIQISSGRGPIECNLAVQHSLRVLLQEAEHYNLSIETKQQEKANGVLCSVTLQLSGDNVDVFLSRWLGTIQWICKSPIRPQQKRKNWFIGIFEINHNNEIDINESLITYESMRSAGPGGQHVNKVNSAVRATYLPLGIAVQVMESRSQLENKQLALTRIKAKIKEIQKEENSNIAFDNWNRHLQIDRGNPTRTFQGATFKEK